MAEAPAPRAAGAFIAAGLFAGAALGLVWRQPTIGLLLGGAIGIAISLALLWRDRRRGAS